MVSQIEIAAELVRLSQGRVKKTGTKLTNELSRMILEEEVTRLDPEDGFLLEPDQSWSCSDALVAATGVNDLVVNGLHVDVRPLDCDRTVAISRALVGTSYLSHGTLVVELTGAHSGRLLGYIPAPAWIAADRHSGDSSWVSVLASEIQPLDLAQLLRRIALEQSVIKPRAAAVPELTELVKFVSSRSQISLSRQRQIVESALANAKVVKQLERCVDLWSSGTMTRIVQSAAVWNCRVENLTNKIMSRFKSLSRDEVRGLILQTGEKWGGQTESPFFRKGLLTALGQESVQKRFQTADVSKLTTAIERILSGRPVSDAIGDLVKSDLALELAVAIKNNRQKISNFMWASAEEIGLAFRQLALQPSYSTHSTTEEAGVESVNEALAILHACDIGAELKEAEGEFE